MVAMIIFSLAFDMSHRLSGCNVSNTPPRLANGHKHAPFEQASMQPTNPSSKLVEARVLSYDPFAQP